MCTVKDEIVIQRQQHYKRIGGQKTRGPKCKVLYQRNDKFKLLSIDPGQCT